MTALTDADREAIAATRGTKDWLDISYLERYERVYRAGFAAGMERIADALDKRMIETNGCAECARFVRGIVGYGE